MYKIISLVFTEEEFRELLTEIDDSIEFAISDEDGISFTDKINEDFVDINTILTNYFGKEVISIHIDQGEYPCIWIAIKNGTSHCKKN